MTNALVQWITRQQHQPGALGILVNPYFICRRALYRKICQYGPQFTGRHLDFGCGRKPYENLFPNVREYIGIDIGESGHESRHKRADVYYTGGTIPFPDSHFDGIFSGEVFEHVFNLEDVLNELFRILRPGGFLLLTVPFSIEEHEAPYDFARYTSFGIADIMSKAGFEIIGQEKIGSAIGAMTQLLASYIFRRKLVKRSRGIKLLAAVLLTAPVQLVGICAARVLPRDDALYTNNLLFVRKPTASQRTGS